MSLSNPTITAFASVALSIREVISEFADYNALKPTTKSSTIMALAASEVKSPRTAYRFLGNSGPLVTKLSLGSWMDVNEKYTADVWYDMMKLAFEHGVNFSDNAEVYGGGLTERNMGSAIKKGIAEGTWSREDLVIITKIFFGPKWFTVESGPNEQGLSRKHIVDGAKASLKGLQLEYVDVIFCRRPDPYTSIKETARAMNFVINQGLALYWGTSQWGAAQLIEACEIADRLGLIRPIVEQTIYSILDRNKVDFEYVDLYKKYNLGLTSLSPLAYGALTGKCNAGTRLSPRTAPFVLIVKFEKKSKMKSHFYVPRRLISSTKLLMS